MHSGQARVISNSMYVIILACTAVLYPKSQEHICLRVYIDVSYLVKIIIPCLATCNLAVGDRGSVMVPHVNIEIR